MAGDRGRCQRRCQFAKHDQFREPWEVLLELFKQPALTRVFEFLVVIATLAGWEFGPTLDGRPIRPCDNLAGMFAFGAGIMCRVFQRCERDEHRGWRAVETSVQTTSVSPVGYKPMIRLCGTRCFDVSGETKEQRKVADVGTEGDGFHPPTLDGRGLSEAVCQPFPVRRYRKPLCPHRFLRHQRSQRQRRDRLSKSSDSTVTPARASPPADVIVASRCSAIAEPPPIG